MFNVLSWSQNRPQGVFWGEHGWDRHRKSTRNPAIGFDMSERHEKLPNDGGCQINKDVPPTGKFPSSVPLHLAAMISCFSTFSNTHTYTHTHTHTHTGRWFWIHWQTCVQKGKSSYAFSAGLNPTKLY